MATSSRKPPGSVVRHKATVTPQAAAPLASGAHPRTPESAQPTHATEQSVRDNALSNTQQVVALADAIVDVADKLHERLLEDILRYDGRPMPAAQQATTRRLLDDELQLRQHAHSLYADAATFVLQGLKQPQGRLMALTTDAAKKIRRIGVISEVIGLIGGILALAAGIVTGQITQVELALEKIRLHDAALDALKPPPAADA